MYCLVSYNIIFITIIKLPEAIFLARIETLDFHIFKGYPHVWLDTYLFFIAVCFVIAAAAFSIIARAAQLSMWYPLIMLLIPASIGFITTKRRNTYYKKLAVVRNSLFHQLIDNNHFYFLVL